jgi:hypothetical protein
VRRHRPLVLDATRRIIFETDDDSNRPETRSPYLIRGSVEELIGAIKRGDLARLTAIPGVENLPTDHSRIEDKFQNSPMQRPSQRCKPMWFPRSKISVIRAGSPKAL